MGQENIWPLEIDGKEVSEREARNFVEKQKAMLAALESIEKFAETGELPTIDTFKKTPQDMLAGLDNWDIFCEEEFSGDRKIEMQAKLKDLREKVTSKI